MSPNARILDFGCGSGRNTRAFREAGYDVDAIADAEMAAFTPQSRYDAALSTHALLHGTPQTIRASLTSLGTALRPGAPLYATFASKRDARYGKGVQLDANTFAPKCGDEAGVAHSYFDEAQLREMLSEQFVIEALEETSVDEIVGSWAHAQRPIGSVHWFVRAVRR